jgi:hypothetical protein
MKLHVRGDVTPNAPSAYEPRMKQHESRIEDDHQETVMAGLRDPASRRPFAISGA